MPSDIARTAPLLTLRNRRIQAIQSDARLPALPSERDHFIWKGMATRRADVNRVIPRANMKIAAGVVEGWPLSTRPLLSAADWRATRSTIHVVIAANLSASKPARRRHPAARIDRTGHVAACITRRVVEPNSNRSSGPRVWDLHDDQLDVLSNCGLQDASAGRPLTTRASGRQRNTASAGIPVSIVPAHPCDTPQHRFARIRDEGKV